MSTVIRSSFLLLALGPLVYYLLSLYNIIDYFRSIRRLPPRDDSTTPPVSILKPVRGMDSEAYENFASYCRLNYPDYEIIFAVSDPGDPVIPVIQKLQRDFPDTRIRLITSIERLGQNHKISNLYRLVKEAQYDLLVMTDSDVRVGPDYLAGTGRSLLRSNRGCGYIVLSLYGRWYPCRGSRDAGDVLGFPADGADRAQA